MIISVHFYSYFKELTGCTEARVEVQDNCTIEQLLEVAYLMFPKLIAMQKSMLIAVGLDYQTRSFQLSEGDEVSLFPPVQGG